MRRAVARPGLPVTFLPPSRDREQRGHMLFPTTMPLLSGLILFSLSYINYAASNLAYDDGSENVGE